MYPQPFLYQTNAPDAQSATRAVLVLPEIFGANASIRSVADRFTSEFGVPAFALDFFYDLTGEANEIGYDPASQEKAVALMHQFTGEIFDAIYARGLAAIQEALPKVQHLTVIGFCLGGRVALIAGKEPKVDQIFSFYGARAHVPFYANEMTSLQVLTSARKGDATLHIHGFFGAHDPSIPEEERSETAKTLTEAGISYKEHLFDAGHAFFNSARATYDEAAAKAAWQIICDTFSV